MATIHLLSGAPGSGKTYYLTHEVKESNTVRILHRDDVRAQLRVFYGKPNDYFPCSAAEEYEAWIEACVSVMISHPDATDFYFDQTTPGANAAAKFFNELMLAAAAVGIDICEYDLRVEQMDTDRATCIANNAKREGFARVPESVIHKYHGVNGGDMMQKLKFPPKSMTLHFIHWKEMIM